jgi:hypothetical protein
VITEERCADLDSAVADRQSRGFRIEMVMPADDPIPRPTARIVRDGAAGGPLSFDVGEGAVLDVVLRAI